MSFWTDLRDGVEALGSVAINYWLPGAGALIAPFTSEGSQNYLSAGGKLGYLGAAAMAGSGLAGGFAGNMGNYNSLLGYLGGGAGGGGGSILNDPQMLYDMQNPAMGGMGGTAGDPQMAYDMAHPAMGGQQQAVSLYNQPSAQQPFAEGAGVAPPGGTGAAPTFEGQQMAGAAGTPAGSLYNVPPYTGAGGGVSNVGTLGAGGLPVQPQASAVAKAAGAMPWGSANNIANLLQGAASLYQANRMPNYGEMADPFAPYRKQYGERLAALERDPSSITGIPGYEAGLQAVRRSMNARGMSGSGNKLAALAKYGGDFYNQTLNRYATLAGGGVNPGQGAQYSALGDFSKYNLIRSGLGNFGYAGGMAGS
ncbi:MAG TPA: hypothetical protein VF077_08755 [Nitrospiraceae bacterium]